ncbi:MAG: FimV family protein [Betaproteobacteria bacterium]|nr:FimV family protein [Betaproteobacteria bacterium]
MRTGVAIALLLGASIAAQAAGLGRLSVNSALGQVLAAEIELLSLQPGEFEVLSARVASPEAYRDAKIEYTSALRLLRFSVEKRAGGQPYVKVTSIAPINEPFLDVLIEVTWPSGRLQREYPILLDPPGFNDARAAATPARPAATPAAPVASAPPSPPAATTPAVTGTPSAKAEMAAPKSEADKDSRKVEKGDTLSKIAGTVKPAEVSLEQMLSALYRENKSAFVDNNMNRLKAGQILRIPSAEEVGKISGKDANQEVKAHVANWKAYREGLAGAVSAAPAKSDAPNAGGGKVASAAVAPPAPPAAESKDTLKLSKTEGGKAAAGGKGGAQDKANALQEEVIAKDKALKEAQSRVTDLEKQIKDMQRLLDLKGGAPAKPTEPAKVPDTKVAAAKPAEPAKVEAPKPAEAAKPADAPKPAEPPVADAGKPSDSAKPVDPPKPAEPKPAPPKKAAPPPPPPEPTLVETAMENLPLIVGGAGVVGLLGFGGVMLARRRKQTSDPGPTSSLTSAFPSDLKPNTSTGGKAGGGLVDTGNSSFLTDFDKTGPGTIDTDEVDPVAEAEVYIAYGRDAQAEEILKEAMARDKSRHEIPLKLLEIYHARKSATAFETVAKELRGAAGESSPVWQKAAAMGAQIDPTNPLYGGAPPVEAVAEAAPVAKPDLDFDLDSSPGVSATAPAAGEMASFDLDLGTRAPSANDLPVTNEVPALDFDLAPPAADIDVPLSSEPAKDEKPSFDFDLSSLDLPATPSEAKAPAPAADLDLGLAFDQTIKTTADQTAPSLSLTDLDLGDAGDGAGGDAVSTKLELAKAYLEIGDKDGAREILQEVAKEGSAAQKDEAQKLIASL